MVLANGVDEEMADLAEEARSFFCNRPGYLKLPVNDKINW